MVLQVNASALAAPRSSAGAQGGAHLLEKRAQAAVAAAATRHGIVFTGPIPA